MAKDTFFLDCDGILHLLRIDRLETACGGSNGALLMLSRLHQKNAEIVNESRAKSMEKGFYKKSRRLN